MKTKLSSMMVVKPIVNISEKIAFVLTDIQSQFSNLTKFLGSEPNIKIVDGQLKIKITGFKPIGIGSVLIKEGENIASVTSITEFQNSFEVISEYSFPTEESQIPESKN